MTTTVLSCAVVLQFIGRPSVEGTVPSAQHPYASPEWWVAIAAIFTFGAIIYQSIETARAAKATEIAADAAKSNAEAAVLNARSLINTERPWLEVVSTIDPIRAVWTP